MSGSLGLEKDITEEVYLLRLGEYDTVPLMLEVTNNEEPAYMTTLYVRHNEALFFDPTDSEVCTWNLRERIDLTPSVLEHIFTMSFGYD